LPVIIQIYPMEELDWNAQAKQLLKSELVRRGISNDELVNRLESICVYETKASVESKISRGTFSAAFLLQCLNAIGCKNFLPEVGPVNWLVLESASAHKVLKSKSNHNA
jgi:hypothetical protein